MFRKVDNYSEFYLSTNQPFIAEATGVLNFALYIQPETELFK